MTLPAVETQRDAYGRQIDYLRISVTDRCNLRCVYCMPEHGLPWIPKAETLSYEEIRDIVAQLVPLGVRRLRVTGGEPTIRPELVRLVTMLRSITDIDDIALSTNGILLEKLAQPLRDAGLTRVNISSDSLRADRISAIARRTVAFDPQRTIRAALAAGLEPVKVNVVVMRGVNDDEIGDYARLTFDLPVHIRFIELMPVGEMRHATAEHMVPSDEVLRRVSEIAPLVRDVGPRRGNGPAAYYRFAGGAQGTIGVITPMTHSYCESCNRVRLTADGRLRTCLFGDHEVLFREAVRRGEPIAPLFLRALAEKPKEHHLLQLRVGGLFALSQTGG